MVTPPSQETLSHSLQYDKFWQGVAPERDVFIVGLTDPAQLDVLRETAAGCGGLFMASSFTATLGPRLFLGAATIMYARAGCGKQAASELDGKIVAGCYLRADLDDKGALCVCP